MQIVNWEHLVDRDPTDSGGRYTGTSSYKLVEEHIKIAVSKIVWPPDSDRFTIYPESGKRRGEGNGVVPIKRGFTKTLVEFGWTLEAKAPKTTGDESATLKGSRPGAFDCHYEFTTKAVHRSWSSGKPAMCRPAIARSIGLGSVFIVATCLVVYYCCRRRCWHHS